MMNEEDDSCEIKFVEAASKKEKSQHFVMLNAVKNLESSCLCMEILYFVQDDITCWLYFSILSLCFM